GSASPLVAEIGKMLSSAGGGGLQGLIERFRGQGLGPLIDSWVSTGANLPISPAQVTQVLGTQQVQQLAAAAGIDVQAASAKLAELLPKIVDQVTPDGRIPAGDLLAKGLGFLSGLQQPKG